MTEEIYWLNDTTREFLSKGYLVPGQTAEQRIQVIADKVAMYHPTIPDINTRIYDLIAKGHCSLSSPVWSNFGTDIGLPISCYGSHVEDNIPSILFAASEMGIASSQGGGNSISLTALRGRGAEITNKGHSSGSCHFAEFYEKLSTTISQGSVRRGFISVYLDITHDDFYEFVEISSEKSTIQDITHGVCIDDAFMERLQDGDTDAFERYSKVLELRSNNGLPYVIYIDNVNNNTVDVYKDKDMTINHSNMCSEIALPNKHDESFVCSLMSMNIAKYDEWKDTDACELAVYVLDAVISEFIEKLEVWRDNSEDSSEGRAMRQRFVFMERMYNFAKRHRSLGIGALGWHSYLQQNMIPFESRKASRLNVEIFKTIKQKCYKASEDLAKELGEPELLKGYGRRNATLNAVAPTFSSSIILDSVSAGIDPIFKNIFVEDSAKGKNIVVNKNLMKLLDSKNLTHDRRREIEKSIITHDGSVQQLDELSDHEKDVFKTAFEISQRTIIEQAASRQTYVDQSQSMNIFVTPDMTGDEFAKLHTYGWQLGIKSFYYIHSTNEAMLVSRKKNKTCTSCEG